MTLSLLRCMVGSLFLMCLSDAALGASAFVPVALTKPDKAEFYLATRGPGENVPEKYGHTVLRLLDREHMLDMGYNWGMYAFDDPMFIPKFLQGYLLYGLDISAFEQSIMESRWERRWFRMEHLNLTDSQKAVLAKRFNELAQPDKRWFDYAFFYRNCSTIPRDLIDEALGGKFKERYSKQSTGRSFRDAVMIYNASSPVMSMGQDVILSAEPDAVMSRWDEMFIPLKLHDALLEMPAFDDADHEIAGSRLLGDTRTLVEMPEPEVPAWNGYQLFWLICGIWTLGGLAFARRFPKGSIRLQGIGMMAWGGVAGLFGLYMALSWAFSRHTVLPRNWNLWLMWPVDWWFVVAGAALLLRGRMWNPAGAIGRVTRWLVWGHLVAAVPYVVIGLSGWITQHAHRVIGWYTPLMLLTLVVPVLVSNKLMKEGSLS